MAKAAVNIEEECKKAWDKLWAQRLKQRGTGLYNDAANYYITASDLEREIRDAAAERMNTYSVRFSGLRGSLLDRVRDWLRSEEYRGCLISHNFGKGHISGQRYRPKGERMAEAELQTMKKKEDRRNNPRPAPIHSQKGLEALCVNAARKGKPRVIWRGRNYRIRITKVNSDVTCVRCKNLLATLACEAV